MYMDIDCLINNVYNNVNNLIDIDNLIDIGIGIDNLIDIGIDNLIDIDIDV